MINENAAMKKKRKRIVIFASGAGSNAQKIIDHFKIKDTNTDIVLIVCNNANAGVLKIAEKENIPALIIERKKFYDDDYLAELKNYKIDLIVLAGFMWKIPDVIIRSYHNKIINIHPALLPKFGGKNMYGNFVHEAVIKAGEKESGITIHYVDEIYDHGKIIFQATCSVDEDDTPQTLSEKIHALEHMHYPEVIESIISS
ncbi:MAG TPA: phosphoribosylglycinamide formyltransferase [Chitinophagaceae bacterium]